MINESGGVEGYKIMPIYADAQSKADVAINEAIRLLEQEKVNLIMGVYSSAHCVPMAQKVDAAKQFMWANVCTASSVFKGKNLQLRVPPASAHRSVRRCLLHLSTKTPRPSFKKDPKDLKVAIIYEDGPYGTGVAAANEETCKKFGMQIVLKEGYSATAPDLSSLVTKLRRARADVILHCRLQPRHHAVLAPGARARPQVGGHDRSRRGLQPIRQAARGARRKTRNTSPASIRSPAQLLDPKSSRRDWASSSQEMVKRYKAETKADQVPPHVSMGFNQTWIFLTDVLPRAIKKYGGVDPGSAAQSRARHRHSGRRHDPGLWREVLPPGPRDVRAERALLAGGDAVHRRQDRSRLARQAAHRRAGAAVAEDPQLPSNDSIAIGSVS